MEELQFAEIFQKVGSYKEAEEVFFNGVKDINNNIRTIATAIEQFREKVDGLRSSGYPLQILLPILKDLKGKVDIEKFIEEGHIAASNGNDSAYLDDLHHRYKTLGNDIPSIGDLNRIGHNYISLIVFASSMASNLRDMTHG